MGDTTKVSTWAGSTTAAVTAAADRLAQAAATRRPCQPVRDVLGSSDIDLAYQVQSRWLAGRLRSGARRVGRKIGLTSAAVQQQLGVDQPDFGALLDDMRVGDGGEADSGRLLQPKAEGEIAFVLGRGLAGDLTPETVRAAVATAHAAIEIVDSRVAGWDISITDTVADNASSGLFVLAGRGVPLEGIDLARAEMTFRHNGIQVSSGTGAASMGHPLTALGWLASISQKYGDPLRAGEIVLSGALAPMTTVGLGDDVEVEVSGIGSARVRFS
jgi:2-keto-4-pentenoate hydratase